MASTLPPRPSMEWLRKTAKDHLRTARATNRGFTLAQAQLDLARQYGFPSWRALKAHVDELTGVPLPVAEQAVARFLELVGTGDLAAVRAAIGADPGLVTATGPHPFWGGRPQALHVAVESGHAEVFELLLASGADVNGRNDGYDHWSPLALAIDRNRSAMQQALLASGARVGLLEALLLGDDTAVGRLLRDGGPTLSAIRPNGGSPLAFARTVAAIDLLLDLGAEPGLTDRWGSTPIEAMSRLGAAAQPLVRHMQSRGIPATAPEYARLGDHPALAALAGRDPAAIRSDAVLLGAVDFGHHELTQWLLDQGANPNARSAVGSQGTALHSAAWEGDLPMARLLLAAGANVHARDHEHDNTPAGWARVAVRVTNNPRCAEIADYLDSLSQSPAPS